MTSKNFNIKETVDRNIQKHQFPSFTNHRSLIGWCSMNYPKVLVNPVYLQKKVDQPQQKIFDLDYMFQKKNPLQRQQPDFVKPLSNYSQVKSQDKGSSLVPNAKISSFSLATTKHQIKAKIFTQNNLASQTYSAVKPLMCVLGPNKDQDFSRKVRQIGQVYYNPPNQSQQMRHLKKLPNTIINQHNLVDIMDENMLYLDLQYKIDISNDLINKVGYLAPNITQLVLVSTLIDNNVLIQLGKSCKKLEAIDISLCNLIEEKAVLSFLKDTSKRLKKFRANHNINSITDKCLQLIGSCQVINDLSINFCEHVTSDGFQFIADKEFEKLGFSTLPNVKGQSFGKVIMSSSGKLTQLDLSFNYAADINNAFFCKVGNCAKLISLNLTQCNPDKVTDEAMNNLAMGIKGALKQPQGFTNLTTLKIARMRQISDSLHHLVRKCPALVYLDANNLQKLTDRFLDQIKGHPTLRTIMLNFTQNITDEKIKEIKQGNKTLNLIRTIVKNTDPTDDGLRMPIPLASMKIKKPKKNKKK